MCCLVGCWVCLLCSGCFIVCCFCGLSGCGLDLVACLFVAFGVCLVLCCFLDFGCDLLIYFCLKYALVCRFVCY